MTLDLDTSLTDQQVAEMMSIPAESWFMGVRYQNANSPVHPNPWLAEVGEYKMKALAPWLKGSVQGKSVLDLFCANGTFSALAAEHGAREVVGIDFSPERIECARFLATTLGTDCRIEFRAGDIYEVSSLVGRRFDVVLCFGGLYHVADPAFVLRQIRQVTGEELLFQTSQVLWEEGNLAKFVVRREDQRDQGMTSIRGGYGTWWCSVECLRELLLHGGFEILEEDSPPVEDRDKFRWYYARCRPLGGARGLAR